MKIFYERLMTSRDYVNAFKDVLDDMYDDGLDFDQMKAAFNEALTDLMFDDEEYVDLDEAVIRGREVDLTTKEHTISYALHEQDSMDKMAKILEDATYRVIPFPTAKQKMIELINSFDSVNETQKRKAQVAINNAKNPNHLTSIMATYMQGEKVDNTSDKKYYR